MSAGLAPHKDLALGLGAWLGEFEILSLLGSGGMGIIYRAWDHDLEREVAIKVLRPELLLTPESHARLAQEAKATARLSHPSIVTIHRLGHVGPRMFLVMELLHGRPLSTFRGQRCPASCVWARFHLIGS
jgi:serine/threonine protein kinase